MAVESTKMTRNQVHQKLKANFQALCTRCPQLVRLRWIYVYSLLIFLFVLLSHKIPNQNLSTSIYVS